jgi:4,5-dihydroxyphthalate decarboxylase
MAELRLALGCSANDRSEALENGVIKPDGIDLDITTVEVPRALFDRFIFKGEFDASEYGFYHLIQDVAAGENGFVGLPIFPSKSFRHRCVVVNRRSGIKTPKDLEGKTIGTPLWSQTAAIWIRGHLQDDYGVDLSTLRWVQGAVERTGSHGTPGLPDLLTPIDIRSAPPDRSLNDMLIAGDIDAVMGLPIPQSVSTDPDIVPLFPDSRAVERDYYQRTGIHPIMHCIAIRRSVYEHNPWIGQSLYDAYCEAKDWALDKMRLADVQRYMLPWLYGDLDEIDEIFGGNPWPYGINANRAAIEALIRFMAEQGMIRREMAPEDLFAPVDETRR